MKEFLSSLLMLILVVFIFIGVFQNTISEAIFDKGIEVESVISQTE